MVVAAPVGYIKSDDQRLEKNPDRRVQEAIQLVFVKFMELGTARQVLLWLLEHGLQLPIVNPREGVRWTRPAYSTVHQIFSNPVYAGVYAYGKTETWCAMRMANRGGSPVESKNSIGGR